MDKDIRAETLKYVDSESDIASFTADRLDVLENY